jgi:hypothetical protein
MFFGGSAAAVAAIQSRGSSRRILFMLAVIDWVTWLQFVLAHSVTRSTNPGGS